MHLFVSNLETYKKRRLELLHALNAKISKDPMRPLLWKLHRKINEDNYRLLSVPSLAYITACHICDRLDLL